MTNFTQKYTIVQFIENVSTGYEFSSAEWPLHSTLIDTFAIDWAVSQMTSELEEVLNSGSFAVTEAEDDAYFGDNGQTRVTLLRKSDSLLSLHFDVMDTLSRGGLVLNDPQFANDGFLPHATVQAHSRLCRGDVVYFKELSIVDMFPDGNPNQRKVLAKISLGHK